MRTSGNDLLGYGPPGGLPELKRAIADHVRDHRGIQCDPGQIIITSGAQQAFALIALTVIEPGAVAWCEDPGHIAVRDVMRLLYQPAVIKTHRDHVRLFPGRKGTASDA